ncbi:MAG: hypothetical protein M3Y51_10195 [Actinomycetota bacterium]|nr:hypothetical protein [Actinomycetota bacterium]
MSAPPSPWTPSDPDASTPVGEFGAPIAYSDAPPLGGAAPVAPPVERRSDRKELVLTASLLVAAIVAGASTLMPWRDYGQRFGNTAVENGWDGLGDSLGRGWVVMVIAVLIAVSGVLIAADRAKAGRILAVLSGTALVLASILEWGLGAGDVRSGPGIGLWVDLAVGVFVIVVVGALGPLDD